MARNAFAANMPDSVNNALASAGKPMGAAPQMQADGLPSVNPGPAPTAKPGRTEFKNAHSPHGTSGMEEVAGALADKLHKVRGR